MTLQAASTALQDGTQALPEPSQAIPTQRDRNGRLLLTDEQKAERRKLTREQRTTADRLALIERAEQACLITNLVVGRVVERRQPDGSTKVITGSRETHSCWSRISNHRVGGLVLLARYVLPGARLDSTAHNREANRTDWVIIATLSD